MIKNRARTGKRWSIVKGNYKRLKSGRRIWQTKLKISEHDELEEAHRAFDKALARDDD